MNRNCRTLDESEDAVCPEQQFLGLARADNEVAVEVGDGRESRHQVLERADDDRRLAAARDHFDRGRLLTSTRGGCIDEAGIEWSERVESRDIRRAPDHVTEAADGSQCRNDRSGFERFESHQGKSLACECMSNELIHE